MPDGAETRWCFSRPFAERQGGMGCAFKNPNASVRWAIRCDGPAQAAVFAAPGMQWPTKPGRARYPVKNGRMTASGWGRRFIFWAAA